MQCVILAGGLGTRLTHLTQNVPKSMIDIKGQPFIHHQLKLLQYHNISEVLLCIGHLGNQIKDFVKDGSVYNIKINYLDEGENLLGTGGALRLAFDNNLLHDNFLVLFGDSYLPIDYKKVYDYYIDQSALALMTVFKNNNTLDKSNVSWINNTHIIYDKEGYNHLYIDYGLSILNKQIINNIPKNIKYDLSDLMNGLSLQNNLFGLEIKKRFYEIGSLQGIQDLNANITDLMI